MRYYETFSIRRESVRYARLGERKLRLPAFLIGLAATFAALDGRREGEGENYAN